MDTAKAKKLAVEAAKVSDFSHLLERVGELKKTGSCVTFVVAKLQADDQTVY
ncbi:hypothetical protein GCM10028810_32380 [Spirosoma litoris]